MKDKEMFKRFLRKVIALILHVFFTVVWSILKVLAVAIDHMLKGIELYTGRKA
jgi:hypothetical protein